MMVRWTLSDLFTSFPLLLSFALALFSLSSLAPTLALSKHATRTLMTIMTKRMDILLYLLTPVNTRTWLLYVFCYTMLAFFPLSYFRILYKELISFLALFEHPSIHSI